MTGDRKTWESTHCPYCGLNMQELPTDESGAAHLSGLCSRKKRNAGEGYSSGWFDMDDGPVQKGKEGKMSDKAFLQHAEEENGQMISACSLPREEVLAGDGVPQASQPPEAQGEIARLRAFINEIYETSVIDRPAKLVKEIEQAAFQRGQQAMAEKAAAHCESRAGLPETGAYRPLLAVADEIRSLAGAATTTSTQPDWSCGEVIAAYADGTIVLDDGLTTWNPERAQQFLAKHPAEPDDYVAWVRFTKSGPIQTCDSDAPGAFKVYRWPAVEPPQEPKPTVKGFAGDPRDSR